jgi:DNA polymerase elongation subunit (family B)
MDALKGKIINFVDESSLDVIPDRTGILDPVLKGEVSASIRSASPLLFMPVTFQHVNSYNAPYMLLLIGIFIDGRKVGILINNPEVYFDIQVPRDNDTPQFMTKLQNIAVENKYDVVKYDIVVGRGFKRYEKHASDYVRMYFKTLFMRKKVLTYMQEVMGYSTTSDDSSHYERVVCRNNDFTMCAWNTVSRYSRKNLYGCSIPVYELSVSSITRYEGDILNKPCLINDNTLVETWDIEAYSSGGLEIMPQAHVAADEIFVIGKSYHWRGSNKSILRVGIVSRPCDAHPDKLTIICQNEHDLIKASVLFTNRMKPEYIIGYNDSDFDWPYLVKRAEMYKLLVYMYDNHTVYNIPRKKSLAERAKEILEFNYRSIQIKLEAGINAYAVTLEVAGSINIDVRTVMRKLYPKAQETKLSSFLKQMNLSSKEDMPISELFRTFRESSVANSDKMADVVHYCVVDAKRCHDLLLKANSINDKRNEGDLSHTTLYDAFRYADGCKVLNFIMADGRLRNLQFTTRASRGGTGEKYAGGYVFRPVPGLVAPKHTVRELKIADPEWCDVTESELVAMENAIATDTVPDIKHIDLFNAHLSSSTGRPITPNDFNSLYPSLIMEGNLSPEYLVNTKEEAAACEADGHVMHDISSVSSGSRIQGWTIRHDTYDGTTLHPGKTVNKFGLYPSILKKLFAMRLAMKNTLKKYNQDKAKSIDADEIKDLEFKCKYIDSKQKAIKVFMNTFYGVLGRESGPLFVLAIASAITSKGRMLIKSTSDKFERKNCIVHYGDTDSVFVSCGTENFVDLDKKYYSGQMSKADYCDAMLDITDESMKTHVSELNAYYRDITGTTFIVLAQEEPIFPARFLGCKMYIGRGKHGDLIKGLAAVKRDASGVLKQTSHELISRELDIYNLDSTDKVISSILASLYSRNWDLKEFKKSAAYKPSKQNVSVLTFRQRMIERNDPRCPPPQPGERFDYVIVDRYPYKYDIKGRKTKLSVGELMEYYDYAIAMDMKIDFNYYISAGVVGLFAQFTANNPENFVPPMDDSKEAYDDSVKCSMHNASAAITKMCANISPPVECKGPALKLLYKKAYAKYEKHVDPGVAKLLNVDSHEKLYESIHNTVMTSTIKTAPVYAETYVARMIHKYGKSIIYKLHDIYKVSPNSFLKNRKSYVASIENSIRQKLLDSRYAALFKSQDITMREIIEIIESGGNVDAHDIVNRNMDAELMHELMESYIKLKTTVAYLENTKAIVKYIEYKIDHTNRLRPVPPGTSAAQEIACVMEHLKRNPIQF